MIKKTLLTAAALGAALLSQAQTPEYRDMNVFSTGRSQTQRTETIFYGSRAEALETPFASSSDYCSLNGTWDFKYFDDSRDMAPGYPRPSRQWGTIVVPGNMEVQGYGDPVYVNTEYEFAPWNPQFAELPELIPGGIYRKIFDLPADWTSGSIYLTVAGCKGGCYYYLNGVEIGYNEDAKNPVRFDITDLVKPSGNELYIKVYRYSTGSFYECQDFWRITGVERDVYLSREKAARDFDFDVVSLLSKDGKSGSFRLTVTGAEGEPFEYELLDASGKKVAGGSATLSDKTVLSEEIASVEPWSAENPYLYKLVMKVGQDWTRFNVGFRNYELTTIDGAPVLLVNGKPIKVKGVNYHEHNSATGHYVTRELILRDLEIMKRNNVNAIRTSHYPQPRLFYELCDSLGFYVCSEANIESHGMGYNLARTLGNEPRSYTNMLYRELNSYRRTKNYPSVFMFSLANESGNGYNFYRLYDMLKEFEGAGMNRPVVHERAEYEWNTDLFVPMYPSADWFRRQGEESCGKPAMPIEYAHAMGNSFGGLQRQWDYVYQYVNLQGGYIWDWVDQGLDAVDENGRHYFTYGGDYGTNRPSDNNFLCNGVVNPDRDPHPGVHEMKHAYQNVAYRLAGETDKVWKVEVENRFYFTTLADYSTKLSIIEVAADGLSSKVVAVKKFVSSLAPQEKEVVELPKTVKFKPGCSYYLNAELFTLTDSPLVPKSSVMASDQMQLKYGYKAPVIAASKETVKIENIDGGVVISSRLVKFTFKEGIVESYIVKGKEQIEGGFGLRPNFWRAPNDNDYGNGAPARMQAWKQASLKFDCKYSAEIVNNTAELTVVYALPENCSYTVKYTVHPAGAVEVRASFCGTGAEKAVTDIPRIGFRMRTGVANAAVKFFGNGPFENYVDRCASSFKGVYSTTADAEYYPYVRPQETGYHTDCRVLKAGSLKFYALDAETDIPEFGHGFGFSALRNSVEDLDGEEAINRPYQWANKNPQEKHDEALAKNVLRRQTHINDVTPRDFVEICIDGAMTGVGGYDSWGQRPEKFWTLWDNRNYSFAFIMSAE